MIATDEEFEALEFEGGNKGSSSAATRAAAYVRQKARAQGVKLKRGATAKVAAAAKRAYNRGNLRLSSTNATGTRTPASARRREKQRPLGNAATKNAQNRMDRMAEKIRAKRAAARATTKNPSRRPKK